MRKNKFKEIEGLSEYTEFMELLEQAKGYIAELQERAFKERKIMPKVCTDDGLEVCAFKKDVSPMFVGMIGLTVNLIADNFKRVQQIVENLDDDVML